MLILQGIYEQLWYDQCIFREVLVLSPTNDYNY